LLLALNKDVGRLIANDFYDDETAILTSDVCGYLNVCGNGVGHGHDHDYCGDVLKMTNDDVGVATNYSCALNATSNVSCDDCSSFFWWLFLRCDLFDFHFSVDLGR
jgi:hypothetical protein